MISVLYFTKYTYAGASTRYRSLQYLPALRAEAIKYVVSPLFDDNYLFEKFGPGRVSIWRLLAAFVRRIWVALRVSSGTIVVIEYELFPWFPAIIERWLVWRGCRVLTDYDDAIFHQYDTHHLAWVRRILGRKIASIMRLSSAVVVGNEYLAGYARRAGAKCVYVIPTVVDLNRYKRKEFRSGVMPSEKVFTIGWIGSPTTAPYLRLIAPALARLYNAGPLKVRLVGSGPIDLPGVQTEIIPWNDETEIEEIFRFDVGIMPLPDEAWTRGKCGLKLIQYMACSLPVVASPVGINRKIVQHAGNGYLASTLDEWVLSLESLRADVKLRKQMGALGYRLVEENYSLAVTSPRMVEILKESARESHL